VTGREPLIGRDDEQRELDRALARGQAGEPTVVLVAGAPGTGKSHLVGTVRDRVEGVVVAVACDPAEAELDFGVIDALVRVAPLSPEVAASGRPRGTADPLEAGAALLRMLDGLPLDGGVTVVVDDAHWADPASLAALTFVARRMRAERTVLCVACRTSELARLPAGLVRLADQDGARIDLGPLDVASVGRLAEAHLGRPLPAAAAERLHAHTGGIPLHVRSLVRELDHDTLAGPGELPAPRSYALWVVARLATCAPAVRDLVEAVAVLGVRAPLATVAEVAGVGDPLPAVDEAIAAELLRVDDAPGDRLLTVAHPLVRAAVLEDMAPSRRAAVHTSAGAVLDGAGGLRHRLLGTVRHDRRLAAEARRVAWCEADDGAPATAGRLLLETARLEPDAATSGRDLLDAVDQHLRAGDLATARVLRPRIADLPSSAERDVVLGHLAYVAGPRRDARSHLEAAWAACDPADRELASRIAAQLATLWVDRRDGEQAREWAVRARQLAPRRASDGHVGHMLAMSHALRGTIAAGIDELGVALADRPVGATDAMTVDLRLGRGVLRLWAHDLDGAAEDLGACLAEGARGSLVARETARYSLAELHVRAGRWDGALVVAEVAASVADAGDQLWISAFPHAVAVQVLAARGEWARAEAHLAAAAAAAETTAGGAARLWVAVATARLAEARGDAAGVVACGDLLAGAERIAFDEGIVPWRCGYAEALVAVGRPDEAAEVAAWLAADGRGTGSALVRAEVARATSAVALAGGDAEGAAARACAGLTDAADAGPFARARLEHVAARAFRAAGDAAAASALLGDAHLRFSALG
jgi:hypothetical protein